MRAPVWIPEDAPAQFPDAREFDREGLIAGGGDLSPERLLCAYASGLFPWYNEPPILWWSPDPRSVVSAESLHVSRSLRRTLRKTSLQVTCGTALAQVMQGCATRPEGTWLTPVMQSAYAQLEELGHVLSYEVWDGETLVGGLYGVLLGGLFAAESKFHVRTDASKIALVCAVTDLFERGLSLFDVQFTTDHLRTMGVHEITRLQYLDRLKEAQSSRTLSPRDKGNLLPSVLKLLK